ADQRHRNRHHRNQRGAQVAQEEIDDQHHQRDGLAYGLEYRGDRPVDEHRGVITDDQLHPGRQRRVDLLDFPYYGARQVQRIGDGLLDYSDIERRLAVEARNRALVDGANDDRSDVADAYRIAANVGNDDVVELLRRL